MTVRPEKQPIRLRDDEGWLEVEPSVWTVRMLTALEQGVEGGRWFRLFDKVFSERNLHAAFQQVARNRGAAGVDHVSIDDFERHFAEHSYGFRPGRGCKDALRRVDSLVAQGHVHVVDADLKGYFDSIPHDRLMHRVKERIADGPTLRLIDAFLKTDILDDAARWTPEAGAPQGAVLSPLLSNVYLDPLDHLPAEHGYEMVRYADDFVILCRTADDAARALDLVRRWVADNGLTLHPTKTRFVDVRTDRFDFLGYTFHGHDHWPRDKSLKNVRDAIRARTKRTTGDSLQCVVASVNPVLRGWFAYFQHSTYRNVFVSLDGWVRRRLRSILRKQAKRHGIGKGLDHQRWPNRFFAEHGLFSLTTAHAAAVQSSRR